jgi:hypothetical protein
MYVFLFSYNSLVIIVIAIIIIYGNAFNLTVGERVSDGLEF